MVRVGVSVDNGGHRELGDLPDRIEHGLAPPGELRVDQHDAGFGTVFVEKDQGIPAAVGQVVDGVLHTERVQADSLVAGFLPGRYGQQGHEHDHRSEEGPHCCDIIAPSLRRLASWRPLDETADSA